MRTLAGRCSGSGYRAEWPLSGLREEKVARVREVKKYAKARKVTVEDAIVELINKGLDS
jgi:hypothetical protein